VKLCVPSVFLCVIFNTLETLRLNRILVDFLDEIDRAVLGFLVDAEDVFADDAEEDELDGAEEIEAQQGGGPAQEGKAEDFFYQDIDPGQHEDDGTDRAQPETEADGQPGEGEDGVGGQGEEFGEAHFGFAVGPVVADVVDVTLVEADEGAEPGHVPDLLVHGEEGLQCFAGHHGEVAGIFHVFESGDVFEEEVEEEGVEGAVVFALPAGAPAAHDVESLLLYFAVHLRQQLRWILQVAVHHGDYFTFGVFESGGEGSLVAEIFGEGDDLDFLVLQPLFQQLFNGIIRATVVDEEELVIARKRFDGCRTPGNQVVDQLGFVVDGDNETKHVCLRYNITQSYTEKHRGPRR